MNTEKETLAGLTEVDLENQIHYFLDEPGIIYKSAVYYRDDEGYYCADVVYTYIPSDD